MIAIDTNIIVRVLTRDNTKQYTTSRRLLETAEIYIPDTVILETEWLLRFAYDFEPKQICSALRKLFGLPNVKLSNQYIIAQTIDWHENGLVFADAFHLALSQNVPTFKTFDEKKKRGRRKGDGFIFYVGSIVAVLTIGLTGSLNSDRLLKGSVTIDNRSDSHLLLTPLPL